MEINKDNFIIGVTDKYDARLLENRTTIEGNLVSLFLQDLTSYDDVHINHKDFVTRDGRFLFLLGKELRESGYTTVDEVTVFTHCSEEVKARIKSMGGFRPIQHLMDVVSFKNYDAILDDFLKSNLLLKFYANGFNLFGEVELDNGKIIVPFELFKKFTSNEVVDWYDAKVNTFGISSNNKITGEEYISFDSNFLESLSKQEAMGTPYDSCGVDINGKKINTFPFLSSTTMGFGTGLHALVGHSGTGKTVFSIGILLSLVSNGRKFIIVENEMEIKDLKIIILTFILNRYFNYTGLTKKKIIAGGYSEEEKEMLNKATSFWNKKFNKSIKIVSISDSDANLTCKIIKKAILRDGCDGFLVDTFKMDNIDAGSNSQNFWIDLINDSKKLHEIALKYSVCGMVTIQLALSTMNRLWLDKSCLSTAKGVCEVLDTCLGIRAVDPDELIEGSPIYCSPFRSKKNSAGEWEEVKYEPDPNNVWRMLFVIKNRKGVCSDDNGVTWLIRYSGDYCSMYETSKARSSRKLKGSNNSY